MIQEIARWLVAAVYGGVLLIGLVSLFFIFYNEWKIYQLEQLERDLDRYKEEFLE